MFCVWYITIFFLELYRFSKEHTSMLAMIPGSGGIYAPLWIFLVTITIITPDVNRTPRLTRPPTQPYYHWQMPKTTCRRIFQRTWWLFPENKSAILLYKADSIPKPYREVGACAGLNSYLIIFLKPFYSTHIDLGSKEKRKRKWRDIGYRSRNWFSICYEHILTYFIRKSWGIYWNVQLDLIGEITKVITYRVNM